MGRVSSCAGCSGQCVRRQSCSQFSVDAMRGRLTLACHIPSARDKPPRGLPSPLVRCATPSVTRRVHSATCLAPHLLQLLHLQHLQRLTITPWLSWRVALRTESQRCLNCSRCHHGFLPTALLHRARDHLPSAGGATQTRSEPDQKQHRGDSSCAERGDISTRAVFIAKRSNFRPQPEQCDQHVATNITKLTTQRGSVVPGVLLSPPWHGFRAVDAAVCTCID